MNGSYPYLEIARRHGADYGDVLSFSDVREFGLVLNDDGSSP